MLCMFNWCGNRVTLPVLGPAYRILEKQVRSNPRCTVTEKLDSFAIDLLFKDSRMFADLLNRIRSYRRRRVHRRFFEDDRRAFYEKIYQGNAEPRVLTGPFKGMAYLNTSDFGPIAPKWLGSYEAEIQGLVCECLVCVRGTGQFLALSCHHPLPVSSSLRSSGVLTWASYSLMSAGRPAIKS